MTVGIGSAAFTPDVSADYYTMSSFSSWGVPGSLEMKPEITVAQYIREEGLARKTGLTARQLAQSLLMSTAVPQMEDYGEDGHGYYPVLRQGAGLANVGKALAADSYILMGEDAGGSYADGKVKVELGDDPERNGTYTFSFSIHNLTNEEKTYALSADFFYPGSLYPCGEQRWRSGRLHGHLDHRAGCGGDLRRGTGGDGSCKRL